ncbi:hypothetical protein QVN60_13650 [Yersinia aleksiciae]|uniref:Uncharacterized protein n=1 Tax=Yersinia aleksiciae TaxID=263819 RepID=A0A0T9TQI5_YERAE|nr:hypothetical protein [Yersinia aleksiciae]MDN0124209.1 hypothetical protein [Yersinia aleksiciae]CNK94800.1 Uncharacterised protein [Yersinia aleksiciae]
MFSIAAIIELLKTGIGFFQKKQNQEQNKNELNSQQNQITLEETRNDKSWRNYMGYTCVIIILWNYIVIPVLALFGVVLPIIPLEQIFRIVFAMLGA